MSETIKDQETLSEQGNAKRRRLVRGAVALAPLVLTLRSGAAAASCTGTRLITTPDAGNGKLPQTTARDGSPLVGSPSVNPDKCVLIQDGDLCGLDKIVTRKNVYAQETLTQSGGGLTCGSSPPKFKGNRVAILSSASAGSLTGV